LISVARIIRTYCLLRTPDLPYLLPELAFHATPTSWMRRR